MTLPARGLAGLALAVVLAVVATACGGTEGGKGSAKAANEEVQASAGPSTPEYTGSVREDVAVVLAALAELDAATTTDELLAALDDAEAKAHSAAAKVRALEPPPGVREGHAHLISALETLSTELRGMHDLLERASEGDLGDMDTLLESLGAVNGPAAATLLRDAITQLEASGVDLHLAR